MQQFTLPPLLLALQLVSLLACDAAVLQKRGSVNSVPVVSQIKSAVQAIAGDLEGARETQMDFIETAPVASQIYSAVEAGCGNEQRALEIQQNFGKTISHGLDGIPGVGHVKGIVHYAVGDKELGDECMKAASRTTCQIAGTFAGGPAGYLAASAAFDATCTGIESAIHGEFMPAGFAEYATELADGIKEKDSAKIFDQCFYLGTEGLGMAEATKVRTKKVGKFAKACLKEMGPEPNQGKSEDRDRN